MGGMGREVRARTKVGSWLKFKQDAPRSGVHVETIGHAFRSIFRRRNLLSFTLVAAQMKVHGHPDRADGNIFRPILRLSACRG